MKKFAVTITGGGATENRVVEAETEEEVRAQLSAAILYEEQLKERIIAIEEIQD